MIQPKPPTELCEWCHSEEPHRWFGGWWICLTCDTDFFSQNGRREGVIEWLRTRGSVTPHAKINRVLRNMNRRHLYKINNR